MSRSIAKRYAKALFELADESYQIKKVVKDMDVIHQAYLDSEDFRSFVRNPVISIDKRTEILELIFGKKVEEITFEFLKMLAEKERLEFLDLIATEFKILTQASEGVVIADVVAANQITAGQSKDIQTQLKTRLDRDVQLNVSVDETMLGGFKIQIEDQVFDYSLDHQLESFKTKVLKG